LNTLYVEYDQIVLSRKLAHLHIGGTAGICAMMKAGGCSGGGGVSFDSGGERLASVLDSAQRHSGLGGGRAPHGSLTVYQRTRHIPRTGLI
jgi:hypothetical protein